MSQVNHFSFKLLLSGYLIIATGRKTKMIRSSAVSQNALGWCSVNFLFIYGDPTHASDRAPKSNREQTLLSVSSSTLAVARLWVKCAPMPHALKMHSSATSTQGPFPCRSQSDTVFSVLPAWELFFVLTEIFLCICWDILFHQQIFGYPTSDSRPRNDPWTNRKLTGSSSSASLGKKMGKNGGEKN